MIFCFNAHVKLYKKDEIVNKFLLAGDKLMPEMHSKRPGFIYSSCGPFTKNNERIQKFKETGDTSYIYKNGIDKACFQHDMAYEDFKDLARKTASDKILRDKAFNVAKNPKYEQLAEELHKPIIRNFKKGTVYLGFKDNIWGAGLADMQLISKFNKGYRFLLCVNDVFSKYARVVLLKDKKGVSIVGAFQKILDESNRKSNKRWINKVSEFYNGSFKKWLKDNDIEM